MKWNNRVTGEKAQFIVNIFRESLFDFAFDSDKVPSLNLHYFCEDYNVTSMLIDEGVFDEGNIIPLNEEFEYIISSSCFLPNGVSSALFWDRNKKGEFEKICPKSDDNRKRKLYQDDSRYICTLLSANATYVKELISVIIQIIKKQNWTLDDKSQIYFCVRELICEFVYMGLNKKYLYNQTNNKFNSKKHSNNDIKYIQDFLYSLLRKLRKEEKFNVKIGITSEVYQQLSHILKGVRVANKKESQLLNTNYLIEIDMEAVDTFSALSKAKNAYSLFLSIYNACCHNINLKIYQRDWSHMIIETILC